MKRRIMMSILAIAMLAAIASVPAAPTASANNVSVSNETQLRAAVAQAGTTPTTITLTADIRLESNFVIPTGADITLRSSGTTMFSLIATRDMSVIEVQRQASLIIENIVVTRASGTTGSGVFARGQFIMNGGRISNNNRSGVDVVGGYFIMNGGTINNNTSGGNIDGGNAKGGGVRNSGTFIMNNGTITDNSASGYLGSAPGGGGVSSTSSNYAFIMFGGTISNNTTDGNGGGVSGSIGMHGGTISNNVANKNRGSAGDGGGVDGSLEMSGGTISNNTASGDGGGVSGSVEMHGGIISNNTANNGGGVNAFRSSAMKGGTIHNNTARESGGGVYIRGAFTIEGGWIFDNTSPTGKDYHSGTNATFNNNIFNPANGAIGSRPPGWVPPAAGQSASAPSTSAISVTINGTPVAFDQPPVIASGRTLVPLRAIFEALGATVEWDQPTQTITAARDDVTITLRIGSNALVKNGQSIALDVPAQVVNGRTLVPVRAISESFGASVEWDQATQTVIITE